MKKRDLRVIFTISGGWAGRTPFSGAIAYRSPVQLEGGWIDGNCSSTQWNATRHEGLLELNGGVTTIGGGQSTDYSPFYGKSFVTGVDLSGSTIRNIGDYAFYGCSGLEYMEIPEQITSIGDYAFYCANLSEVVCRATTPPALGSHNFNASSTMLYVPAESVEAYRADEDWSASVLRIYPIGYEQKYIRYNAESAVSGAWLTANTDTGLNEFDEETGEGVLYLNSGVTTIGGGDSLDYSPFNRKSDLVSVDLDDSGITGIGHSAFRGCTSLTSFDIPSGQTEIGGYAFGGCTSLTSIVIPEGIVRLRGSVFRDCSSLASVSFPSTLMNIGGNSFRGTALTSITIPSGVTIIDAYAFDCASLTTVTCNATTPPALESNNFPATDTLYVPMEGYEAYRADEDWASVFTSIRPQGYTYITVGAGEHGSATGSGWYQVNAYVIITATADEHYHFDRWNDGSTSNPRAIIVGSIDTAYTATFAIDEYTLVVTGDAHTTVSGSGTYGYGSEVEITATPDEHYHFTAWSDGNTNATRTITVTENITLSASSEINEYTLTVSAGQHGTATGSGTYPYGTQVQISATADTDYHFAQWNDGNTDNPRTVVVSGDTTYTASFESDAFTVTITGDAHTTVTGSGTYPYGTQVQISATPDEHYHFVAWSDGDTNATRTITVTGNITLSASSAINEYTLTVSGDAHTAVSGSGTYDYSTQVQISATPDEHYHFTAWSDGNTDNPRTVVVTGDISLSASSAIDTYTLTVTGDAHTTVSGSGTYPYGTQVQISATPVEHYHFTAWSDGNTSATRTITMTSDVTLSASSAIDTYTLTVTGDAHTAVTGSGTYDYGTSVQVSATPDSHYHFTAWSDGNTDNPRTVVVTGNIALSASSAIDTYTITVSAGQHGSATGSGTYAYGASVQISATADTGYEFSQWNDGNTDNPRTITVTGNATYTATIEAMPTIKYNAPTAVSGDWVTNNTDTTRNTYDTSTGDGVLYLNSGVTTIGGGYSANYSPFNGKTDLVSVEIGGQITTIGNYAFRNCTGLASISIGNSVTTIGDSAFYDCTALASITVDSSNTTYNDGNGSNCIIETSTNTLVVGCKNTVIPNSVTTIGEYAFSNCTALTSITIPDSVTSIGSNAFYNCTGLTSISIGSGVTSIGNSAFNTCSALTSITIPNSVTTIGNSAFNTCSALTSASIGNSVTTIGEYAFSNCTALTSITIPDSVTSIGSNAFYNCTGLTSISIGSGVTSIGNQAFYANNGLTNLATITVDSSNTTYNDGSGKKCIVETSSNTLILGCKNTTIPSSVTKIGSSAFYKCTGLTYITIPATVKTIDEAAFAYCSGLTSITIPNSGATTINFNAFSNCTGLTSASIGNSVTSIGTYAFGNCSNLKTVTCRATTPPTLGGSNFGASNDTLKVPSSAVSTYKNTSPWKNYFTTITSI